MGAIGRQPQRRMPEPDVALQRRAETVTERGNSERYRVDGRLAHGAAQRRRRGRTALRRPCNSGWQLFDDRQRVVDENSHISPSAARFIEGRDLAPPSRCLINSHTMVFAASSDNSSTTGGPLSSPSSLQPLRHKSEVIYLYSSASAAVVPLRFTDYRILAIRIRPGRPV